MKELKILLLHLFDQAKEIIRTEGQLIPLAFPLTIDKILEPILITFKDDHEKLQTFFSLGTYCRENDVLAIILGLDTCNRTIPKNEKSSKIFFENLDTERFSLYPKNWRKNFVLLQYINFIDSKHNLTLLARYKQENKNLKFFEPFITNRMKSSIVDITISGWKRMNGTISY